jgi:P4 family phage/plasmid primase-like protien
MMSNLKSAPYLSNICKMIGSHSIKEDFESKIINKTTYELPIKDGKLINFKTLEIRERNMGDFYSFESPVSFNPDLDLDCVEHFFDSITCGDKELKNYHQLLWGYLMTGEISDRSLHIFYGLGCNGKSSIVNIFQNIMEEFYTALSEDITLKKTGRGASPELMSLLHTRVGSLPESEKREELNSKRVKTITGDDQINARHLFGHTVTFKTQCKLIWSTNHKPKINVEDQAILDRIKLIPFNARFEKTQKNTDYIKDLQENKLDEFFTWFAVGCNKWYSGEELKPCKSMVNAMKTYISENDIVEEFIEEAFDIVSQDEYEKVPKLEKKDYRTKKSTVYAMFVSWINTNNRKDESLGKKEFYTTFGKKCESIKVKTDDFLCKLKSHCEEDDEEDFVNLL